MNKRKEGDGRKKGREGGGDNVEDGVAEMTYHEGLERREDIFWC